MRGRGGWSGRHGEPCGVEAPGDLGVDDAEGLAERGRGLGLIAGQ